MDIPSLHRRRFIAAAPAALAVAGAGRQALAATPPPSRPGDPTGFLGRRSPVFARSFLASSSSPPATRVGLRVLEEGGNAFDAAVAMAGMMAVVEPMMSGLGGDTLEQVARGGREAFYAGPVAQAIADTLTAGGVATTAAEVGQQAATWVEPLSVRYRGRDVLGLPPNSQSVVALIALGILEGYDLGGMAESARLHHEIEALRMGFEFAIDQVGEPSEPMTDRVGRALSAEGLAASRGRLTDRATAIVRPQGGNSADTTYMCAIDRDGNALSQQPCQPVFHAAWPSERPGRRPAAAAHDSAGHGAS